MHKQLSATKAWQIAAGTLFAAMRLARRRLWVVVTLALAIGSAGQTQTPLAQAAPPGDASIGIWLTAEQVGAKHTICPGDQVVIRVMVLKKVEVEGRGPVLGRLPGVEVGASVVGQSDVGRVSPAKNSTSLKSDPVGATYFTFAAEKPGTVAVVFKGKVNVLAVLGLELSSNTVKADVTLTVEDCKYQISAISRWRVPGEAHLTLVARIKIAGMVEDGGGHYRGTARVQWIVFAGQVGDCTGTLPPDSQAEATGQVFGPDEFVVDVSYDTAIVPLAIDCKGAGGNMEFPLTPDPVTLTVPTTGGNETLAQILRGPEDTPGTVVIIVKRAKGQ